MSIFYTKGEERTNSISHGVGIGLGTLVIIGFLIYCYRNGDSLDQMAVWLYAFGMLGSYVASTLYHASKLHSKMRRILRRWDHAAIYWHIAGSYSPITLIALRDQGYWGWILFGIEWTCAIVGTVMSFRNLKEHSNLETVCFVLMGLAVLIAFKPLVDAVGPATLWWIIGEGICYITGAVFYTFHNVRYMHSVFHFFVLAGSFCHIMAVWDMLKDMM